MTELFMSSKIPGVKDLHVCFFKTGTGIPETTLWTLINTYNLPHLQTWEYKGDFYHASLGPVSSSRYEKILKATKSKSLDSLRKHGQVLFPLKSTFCIIRYGKTISLSRPHVYVFSKMKDDLSHWLKPTTWVGKGKPKVYKKVI